MVRKDELGWNVCAESASELGHPFSSKKFFWIVQL